MSRRVERIGPTVGYGYVMYVHRSCIKQPVTTREAATCAEMPYPLEWLTSTFPSKERTIELLQPELENNVLSCHDYELAVRFLPGSHRYWPVCLEHHELVLRECLTDATYQALYGSGATGATLYYGYYVARPRWGQRKTAILGGATFALGMIYGGFRRFVAHRQFSQALENPEGFVAALGNVHKKLGGDGNIGFTLQRIQAGTPTNNGDSMDTLEIPPGNWKQADATESDKKEPSPGSKSRWEEIRAANARNMGQRSTWDEIRQQHERSKIPPPIDGTAISKQEDRVGAQAKFEAMLEAERQRSRDHQDHRELL
ncbi:hypothetical protein ID866_1762 [Astraeus odoratus]|nr:hypothetical protein ID866_1762 [Astraeus odoratus]